LEVYVTGFNILVGFNRYQWFVPVKVSGFSDSLEAMALIETGISGRV
jgi:hypothetical protein